VVYFALDFGTVPAVWYILFSFYSILYVTSFVIGKI